MCAGTCHDIPAQVLHSCYATRYPADKRSPVVIWRGTTTDTRYTEFNEDNWLQVGVITNIIIIIILKTIWIPLHQ
jgi:hypothetical protein